MDDAAAFGAADDALDDALDDADALDAALDDDADEETSFIDPVPIGAERAVGGVSQKQQVLKAAVDGYYNTLAKDGQIPLFRDSTNFKLVGGKLRLKAYPNVRLINAKTKKNLALTTVYTTTKGAGVAITSGNGLGFVDCKYDDPRPSPIQAPDEADAGAPRRRLPSPIQAAQLQRAVDEADAAATTGDSDSIGASVDEVNSGDYGDFLPPREIRGFNENLKTIRGEKAVQESTKVALLQSLEGFRENLERAVTTERVDQIEREIQKAEDQLRATEDSIDALDQESRSQIRQIRDSLLRVLDKNTTLAERVRTLFREQGVTIASILTAIGMAISTLVLALTGGSAAVAPVAPSGTGAAGGQGWPQRMGKEEPTSSRAYAGPTGRKGCSRAARYHRKHPIVAPQPP